MVIINIKDLYRKKGINLDKDKKQGEQEEQDKPVNAPADILYFKEKAGKVAPRMLEKRVTELMRYLNQQKGRDKLLDAFIASKGDIINIITLTYAFDIEGSGFAEQLAPETRKVIKALEIAYIKYGDYW